MTDLSAQKRLAADVLGVGENRVRLDPDRQGDIAEAITREDIRELIDDGVIEADQPGGNSRGRAREREAKQAYGHQKGAGSRKGKADARQSETDDWGSKIKAQRRRLRELRDADELSRSQYRDAYAKAGGGEFDSVADLERYINDNYGDS
jgi:large subunit ribosomal protein L19e